MNTYTVTKGGEEPYDVEADDFSIDSGVVYFRDEIGRALVVTAITPDLSIECEYGDDPLFDARLRLAEAQRSVLLDTIENEIAMASVKPNRAQRRHN